MPDRTRSVISSGERRPESTAGDRVGHGRGADRAAMLIAVAMVVWCLAFAAVNVGFEVTGRFDVEHAEYAAGLSVLDWFVAALKVMGAGIALASVRRPSWLPAPVLTVALWGAYSTLALYVMGSLVEAVGMVTGLAGSVDQITRGSVVYVAFFLVAAVGFGLLAVTHQRREHPATRLVALGIVGAPVLLGLILVVVPAVLVALGVFPS